MRSICQVGVHLIWATKDRRPWLSSDIRPKALEVLGRIAARRHCRPIAIGGWVDHVHLYVALSPQISVVGLVNALKVNSTSWIRRNLPGHPSFEWQRGYAAAGVDPRDDEALQRYIQDQEAIHQARRPRRAANLPIEIASPCDRGGREPTPKRKTPVSTWSRGLG